ncbi:MAG: response regulator [Ignavibacteriaceae bacterium]|nr:response regulator [Ignavibacteriaceae bacterium]
MTILIVDDNRNMRAFIREIIQSPDNTVIEASNGLMAVEMYLIHQPDIVFMDIQMDQMDGIEATGLIRRYSKTVKIVMVTDFKEEILREKARAAGANHYLHKSNLLEIKNFFS